jgi:hypothetical protein
VSEFALGFAAGVLAASILNLWIVPWTARQLAVVLRHHERR